MQESDLAQACISALWQHFNVDASGALIERVTGHSNEHWKLSLPDQSIFGFKSWSTATEIDGLAVGCSRRDEALNKIAHVVAAPDVCSTRYCCDLSVPPFNTEPIVISKWIKNAVSMDQLSDEDQGNILSNGKTFFNKLGEWIALGTALGFRDWTTNNLVWSGATQSLAIIDLDWSFDCGKDPASVFTNLISTLRPIDSERLEAFITEAKSGITSMQQKLIDHDVEIKKVLHDTNDEKLQKFTLKDISGLAQEAEDRLRKDLK